MSRESTHPSRQQRAQRSYLLRERGLTWEQIADVWETDYPGTSPRVTLRWAHDLTHQEIAERWNLLDPGEPTMTKSRIFEFEAWPGKGGRRPSVYALRMLARIYQTTGRRLLTDDEYARFDKPTRDELDSIDHRNLDTNQKIIGSERTPTLNLSDVLFQNAQVNDGDSVETVKRREFGRAAALITLALPLAGVPSGEPVEVTSLKPDQVVADLYALDDRYGGAAVADVARRRLVSLKRQLGQASLKPSAQTHVQSIIGTLATCAAWLIYDAGDAAQARVLDAEALYAAHLANNVDLQIEVLASMSMQANGSGNPNDALNLADSAMTIARTASPRVRSLLAMRKALAAASLSNHTEFKSARSEAWRLLEKSPNDDQPSWFNFFDERELMGLEALALIQFGRYQEAIDILNAVVAQQRTYLRNKAYYAVVRADALLGASEPEEAALTLRESLPTFTEITSARTFEKLKKVRSSLQPFVASSAAVAECDTILGDLLA